MLRRKKIWFLGIISLGLGAFFLAQWGERSFESYVRAKAAEVLQTRLAFSRLDLDAFQNLLTLHDVAVFHPERKEEAIAQVEEMKIHLTSLSSLFKNDKPIEIEMSHPKIRFATTRAGEWDLSGKIPLILRGGGEKRLAPFNIESISMKEGEIEFRDGRFGPVTVLSKVQFQANHWCLPSKEEPLPISFEGSFLIRNSSEAKVKGKGDFLSPRISLSADLKVKGLPLPPFAPYYEGPLPARIVGGAASFSARAQVDHDQFHIPVHAEVSGLKVELKKNKAFGFAADMVVDSMRNSRGNVELDLLIQGDLRKPQFVVLTDFNSPIGSVLKQTGKEIKEGFKSGWHKFKSIF